MKRTLLIVLMMCAACWASVTATYAPVTYDCDGVDTTFTFSWDAWNTATGTHGDVVVTLLDSDGNATVLVENSAYTVSATNSDFRQGPGGTVTTTSAYASGYKIVVSRATDIEQETTFSRLTTSNVRNSVDRLTMMMQELDAQLDLCIASPVGGYGESITLPAGWWDDSGYLYWNGTTFSLSTPTSSGIAVTAWGETWIQASNLSEAKDILHDDTINVMDSPYSAVGDGVADDTVAIQTAHAAAVAAGATLYFPAGTYRTTETIEVDDFYFTWRGVYMQSWIRYEGADGEDACVNLKGAQRGTFYGMGFTTSATANPEAVVILGRSSAASSGLFYFERCYFGGYPQKAMVYSINSEIQVFKACHFLMGVGSEANSMIWTATQDAIPLGLAIDSGLNSSGGNTLSFLVDGCYFQTAVTDADQEMIKIQTVGSTQGLTIKNSFFYAPAGSLSAITLYQYGSTSSGSGGGYEISNNRFEGAPDYAIFVNGVGTDTYNYVRGLTVRKNVFGCSCDIANFYVNNVSGLHHSKFTENLAAANAVAAGNDLFDCEIEDSYHDWAVTGDMEKTRWRLDDDASVTYAGVAYTGPSVEWGAKRVVVSDALTGAVGDGADIADSALIIQGGQDADGKTGIGFNQGGGWSALLSERSGANWGTGLWAYTHPDDTVDSDELVKRGGWSMGGNFYPSTNFYLPTADGAADQVLATNGSGVMAWTNQAGAAGGDAWGDAVDADIVPDGAGTRDLGSAAGEFDDVFLGDASVINFGLDQDVTVTHVPDTGLTFNLSITAADLHSTTELKLTEIADAGGDVAGVGQIWVNTETPNTLWFTDDAGTDTQLGVGGSDTKVKIDAAATAGYLGAANNDGVLRVETTELSYADGGDFVTLGIADDGVDSAHYAAASIDNEHLADNAADSDEIAAGAIDLAHMSAESVDSDQYVDASIDYAHLASDVITGAAAIAAFESGDTFLIMEAGVGLREADFDDLPGSTQDFADVLGEDADGGDIDQTSLGKLEFFDAGLYLDADADGVMDITSDGTLELHSADWDISTTGTLTNTEWQGTAIADAYVPDDITIQLATTVTTNADLTGDVTSTGNATDITESVLGVSGTDTIFPADPGADRLLMWDDDPGALVWSAAGAGDMTKAVYDSGDSGGVDSITTVDATTGTSYPLMSDTAVGTDTVKTDGALTYDPATGTLATTQFSGGGAGLLGVDAATGDSATDFFDAGEIADARIANAITVNSTAALTTTANAITLGDGDAGDPAITFDSGNDGVITYKEDEQDLELTAIDSFRFPSDGSIIASGSASLYGIDNNAILRGDTGVLIDLDDDNDDTGDAFIVRDGANATLLQITEQGAWTSAITGTTVNFGNITSLEIPNSANPTTDAAGEAAVDTDDHGIEIYTDASYFIPVTKSAQATIRNPADVQGDQDAVKILDVHASWAPHGITITDCGISTDNSSSYSVNFEEWTSPSDGAPGTIEAVATSTSREAEDNGTIDDGAVAVGSMVYIDLPTTAGTTELGIWITYTVNPGD